MTNKYSNASIYTIRNYKDDSLIYVGSTISPIHKRLCAHKSLCKGGNKKKVSLYNYIENDDWTDWYIELHERYPCNDRAELLRREGQVIREIGSINKSIAGRTMKEYYIDNKDDYKKYYIDNKDDFKKYYKDNADKKREYQREYNKNNADKIREYNREYYNDNADKIREYQREYYHRKRCVTP